MGMGDLITRARLALAAGLVAAIALPANAGAVELQGPWAPFNRCPVDHPLMQAVANTGNGCVASNSTEGTFVLGKTTAKTGHVELQFGGTGPGVRNPIPPGYMAGDPVNVPGGLAGIELQVPNNLLLAPIVRELNRALTSGPLGVTATVELAGPITSFDLFAPTNGRPLVTIPVKVHLRNPVLGPNCYIGSNADPIVLKPRQTPLATKIEFLPDPLGSQASFIQASPREVTLIDDTFAAPKARGCGLLNLLDAAINSRVGLPSPAGNNLLELRNATAGIVGSAPSGAALAAAWHAAEVP